MNCVALIVLHEWLGSKTSLESTSLFFGVLVAKRKEKTLIRMK
jgi:hypothetical protein